MEPNFKFKSRTHQNWQECDNCNNEALCTESVTHDKDVGEIVVWICHACMMQVKD